MLLRKTSPLQIASGLLSSTALESRLNDTVPGTNHDRFNGGASNLL
jgi:hypothetical protein